MFDIRKKIKNMIYFLSDRRFFWSIMLAYVFIKLLPVIAFDKKFTYFIIVLAFFILMLRIVKVIVYDKKNIFNKYRISTLIFVIICICSAIYNIGFNFSNFNVGNLEYRVIVVLIINLFVLFSFDSYNDYKEDIKYLKNIFTINSVFSFFNLILSIYDAIINNKDRIWGLTISVWSFTHFVAISFAINLYLVIVEKKILFKIFFIINLILHLITLIFVQQRAGYICVISGLIFTLILMIFTKRINKVNKYLMKYKIVVLLFVALLIFLIILLSKYINLNKIYGKMINLNTNGRLQIKKISLKCLTENNGILFGLIGNLHLVTSTFEYSAIKTYISNASFHDILFCILMCFGVFAYVIFVIFIIQIIWKMIVLIKYAKLNDDIFNLLILCSFGILGSLIGGLFDDNMLINLPYLPNLIFFILISIICSINEKELNIVK